MAMSKDKAMRKGLNALAIASLGLAILIIASSVGIYFWFIKEYPIPKYPYPVKTADPTLKGMVWSSRPVDTLILTRKGLNIYLADYDNHNGGDFLIKGYKDFAKRYSASIEGEGYITASTIDKSGNLEFTIPHFSQAEIAPIYTGLLMRSRLEPVASRDYGVYVSNTFTNITLMFRGYNDTVTPSLSVNGNLYRLMGALANNTYWNFTMEQSDFILDSTNDIIVRTASGGLDWAIHADQTGINITWDLDRTTIPGSDDQIEYYNISMIQYSDVYEYVEANGEYYMEHGYPIIGNTTGTVASTHGLGKFQSIEAQDYWNRSWAMTKGTSDTTLDSISDLRYHDATTTAPNTVTASDGWYTVVRSKVMAIDEWNTSEIYGGLIVGVWLKAIYSVYSGYSGTNYVQYAIEGTPLANTNIHPANGQSDYEVAFDLYAHGINSIAEIADLNISFSNNDGLPTSQSVDFDRIWILIQTYNDTTPCGQHYIFQSEPIDDDITSLTLSIAAYVNYEGQLVRVGYTNNISDGTTNIINITSTTPAWYHVTLPIYGYDDGFIYVCAGSFAGEGLLNDTLNIDTIKISYVRSVATPTPLADYDFIAGIANCTHHAEMLAITLNGLNFSRDSTNYTLDYGNRKLTLHLGTLTVGVLLEINITVLLVQNTDPVITFVLRPYATVDLRYIANIRATDVEGDNITFGLKTDASFLSINATTGALTGTPDEEHGGEEYVVIVYANDSYGGSSWATFNLTVMKNPWSIVWGWIGTLFTGGISIAGIGALVMVIYYIYQISSKAKENRAREHQSRLAEERMNLMKVWLAGQYQGIRDKVRGKKAKKGGSNGEALFMGGD